MVATKNILIVDDEEDILELIKYNLTREKYNIICATTGEVAIEKATSTPLDLVILDLMLPGIDGLEVARQLKRNSQTAALPIIMLTAKDDEVDIVTGLELGADDYITKPFSPRVLIARVKAILRRQVQTSDDNAKEKSKNVIDINGLTIHPGRRDVSINGQPVELTFTEFQVLYYLAKRPGWVSTRSQIVDAVRGVGYAVTDRSVDVQIVGLRKKLRRFGKCIQTVRGVGYKFKETI